MDTPPEYYTDEEVEMLQYEHLEELNQALETERDLVLKTQENYRVLKKKFLELRGEAQAQKIEMQELLTERERQMDALTQMSARLKTDNEMLREKVKQLTANLEDITRRAKHKEEELRREFSDQIAQLIESTDTNNYEEITLKFDASREEERLEHENRVQKLSSEIRRVQSAMDEEVQLLKAELREERRKRIELAVIARSTRADLEATRSLVVTKQNELIAARSELNRRLKENMEKEIAFLSTEESFRRTLTLRSSSFEQRISEYERFIEEKEKLIADLRDNIKRLESQQSAVVAEDSLKQCDEEKRRLENELKQISLTSKQKEEKDAAIIEELKQDRNKLELTVAELKKNIEAYPSKTAELNRIKALLEEKERQLSSSRRNYRKLLQKVETSLVHLEKQQQNTKRKLEEEIIGGY